MVNYNKLSDAALVKRIAGKEDKAFEELYQRYSGKLFHYFFRISGNSAQAQDLLQDLFLKLIHKAHLFDDRYSFSTWFYTISYHLYINLVRKKSRLIDPPGPIDTDEMRDAHSEDSNMESNLDRKLFRERVDRIIDKMDEEKSTTFILRYRQNFTVTEISEIMNCPVGTVKSRLHYLLKEIGSRLGAFQDI